MYTNTSKFRVNGKYGLFTIPKGILRDLGWAPGDLLGFWGIDEEVIHIQKMCSGKDLEKVKKAGEKYDSKVYKTIAKFGGENGTYGVKSLPEFLMKEFEPKDGQKIYFLPARETWLNTIYSVNTNDVLFASFDPENLKRYDKPLDEDYEIQDKKLLAKLYHIPFFKGTLELTEGNNTRARNKVRAANKLINRDRILGHQSTIKYLRKSLKRVELSNHPRKNQIIISLKRSTKENELKIQDLKKNPEVVFEEWQ